jgi:N-formylglutamate deformylase
MTLAIDMHQGSSALVLDSPHSGTHYPEDFAPDCAFDALRAAEDTHVEQLWGFAPDIGATLLHARFPRTYIDPNRSADEVDETLLDEPWPRPVCVSTKVRLGKGLVWRMLDDGTPIYRRKLGVGEVQARIDRCWTPYHQALDQAVTDALHRHGHVIHLNCHSMPAVAQRYATDHPWLVHADFVLGDRDGTSADPRLTRWMERFLNSRGYTVSVNHPYKGVEIVRRHGRPQQRCHAIQVEVNKRLYMNELTLERNAGFKAVQDTLRDMARQLLLIDMRADTPFA